MNLKDEVLKDLEKENISKVRYFKKSPYQKRRYKPEFVEQEVWVYTPNCRYGYCITEETFNNKEYWKNYRKTIINDNRV